jgi:hypothetical protein
VTKGEAGVLVLLMVAGGLVVLAANTDAEEDVGPDMYMVPLAMEPVEREAIFLDNANVTIPQGKTGVARPVAVALRRTAYVCELLQVTPNASGKVRTRLDCYELCAKAPYTWSMWAWRPLVNFALFAQGPEENYLTWVDGHVVCAAEVSTARDRCLSLAQFVPRNEYPSLAAANVWRAVPRSRAWGLTRVTPTFG